MKQNTRNLEMGRSTEAQKKLMNLLTVSGWNNVSTQSHLAKHCNLRYIKEAFHLNGSSMGELGGAVLTNNNNLLSEKKKIKKKKSFKQDSLGRHSHLNNFFTDLI